MFEQQASRLVDCGKLGQVTGVCARRAEYEPCLFADTVSVKAKVSASCETELGTSLGSGPGDEKTRTFPSGRARSCYVLLSAKGVAIHG